MRTSWGLRHGSTSGNWKEWAIRSYLATCNSGKVSISGEGRSSPVHERQKIRRFILLWPVGGICDGVTVPNFQGDKVPEALETPAEDEST